MIQKKSKEKTQLLTIPYSHYCEFGRWSLDANKIPYDHHGYAPGGHVLPTLNLRICGETKYFASSSRVTKVSKDTNIDNNNTEAQQVESKFTNIIAPLTDIQLYRDFNDKKRKYRY